MELNNGKLGYYSLFRYHEWNCILVLTLFCGSAAKTPR